jgi:hypothetical protein
MGYFIEYKTKRPDLDGSGSEAIEYEWRVIPGDLTEARADEVSGMMNRLGVEARVIYREHDEG